MAAGGVQRMKVQAEIAAQQGEWRQAAYIGRDMLTLDPENAYAQQLVKRSIQNQQCEPVYRQALTAAHKRRWKAVTQLMNEVRQTCPDYGDPTFVVRGRPIQIPLIDLLHEQHVFNHDRFAVNSVMFSPDGTLLASCGDDHTVRIWEAAHGQERAVLFSSDPVYSVAFSPTMGLLASGGLDGVRLWQAANGRKYWSFPEKRSRRRGCTLK
ncbi:MAG: hypothetical protein IT324_08175 [Anaerolineae bacterium]|nr:hypothetical protein [Anaerolineae bacterium]